MRRIRSTDGTAAGARRVIGSGRWGRVIAACVFASLLIGMPALADRSAAIGSAEASGPKAYWQDRYRNLLGEADQLRATIETERELYADANRRNHRRGDKRHRHRIKVQEAEDKLKDVLSELATIQDDGRRAGALPGWFYEVEIERASPARPADAELEPADSGRNPLYSDDKG